jgi:hypothetical protein
MPKLSEKQAADRAKQMHQAGDYLGQILVDAELRGINAAQVALSIVQVFAARQPTATGEVLVAVRQAIQANPVTKVIEAKALN